MTRRRAFGLPRTLRGQLVLVILVTFIVVQGISLWLFVDERRLAVRAALGLEAASRAANVVRLLEATPADLRRDILMAASSPLARFEVAPAPLVTHDNHDMGGDVALQVQSLLPPEPSRAIRVELHKVGTAGINSAPRVPEEMRQMHDNMMRGNLSSVEMRLSITLADGNWLNVSTRFHRPPIQWPWASVLSYALSTLAIMAVVWIALSRLTGPLRRLSVAAERLGRGEPVEELPETGPEEVRRLTEAFNRMQARLTRFISERTRLLAALGHDLRSPLTAMRVRAEMVDDPETRERLTAIIAEMQEMVESTLSFARGMVSDEETQNVALRPFLGQLAEEMSAMGPEVEVVAADDLGVRIKPVAMRRALRNLIENAQRYAGRTELSATRDGDMARICIRDHGPGIPEADLKRVLDPFVRVEKSRNKETGGTGLGLSIASTIVHAHGGEIILQNATGGGLEACVTLPLQNAPGEPSRPRKTRHDTHRAPRA
ncbi:MAG TPA: HAMP domain-containing protein [Aliiroseovarius sp.]|nr:HAMP domain-containing protein [Aliiroseovarius sp.]